MRLSLLLMAKCAGAPLILSIVQDIPSDRRLLEMWESQSGLRRSSNRCYPVRMAARVTPPRDAGDAEINIDSRLDDARLEAPGS